MSYWAIIVITNLLTIIPVYGDEIVNYILGGYSIGNATLSRFYSLHYLLPFIIVALTIFHLITLHNVGGSNPLGIKNIDTLRFSPYYIIKDILGVLIAFIPLFYYIFYNPYYLSHPDNFVPANPLVTPSHIIPEIYFLAYFAILRSIPDKTLGVILLIFSILILLFLPFLHKGLINTSVFRPIYKYFLYIFFINFLLLTYIGQSPVSEPYITIGQILLTYHFIFILVIIPLISILESYFYLLLIK
jgi:ubiquinol-cytochrome c reductase cytochrome b subunit